MIINKHIKKKKNSSCLLKSAYEVKNNCCVFEKLFKAKNNGVFLFEISLFVLETFSFLYYADRVMTSQIVPLKQLNTESRISTELLEQWSSNLAPEMHITKGTESHLLPPKFLPC